MHWTQRAGQRGEDKEACTLLWYDVPREFGKSVLRRAWLKYSETTIRSHSFAYAMHLRHLLQCDLFQPRDTSKSAHH